MDCATDASMDISAVMSTCHGVIDAFYPGIHGAAAIAETIFGDHNPGGKLPFTMCEDEFGITALRLLFWPICGREGGGREKEGGGWRRVDEGG